MGKHARTSTRRWRAATTGAGLVVLLAGAGAWAVLSNGGASADGAAGTPTGTPTSSATASIPASARSGPTPSSSTSSGGAAPTTDSPLARAQASIQACAAHVAASERIARAAAASARDWGTHTGAQRKLDDGTYTLAQTKAAWASSKANGPGDLKEFAAAAAAAKGTSSGCLTVVEDTRGTGLADGGTDCDARSRALASVQTTGTKVNAQWAQHIAMMAAKAHTDGAAYHRRWMGMVEDSQTLLKGYQGAAKALAAAPACRA